LHHASKITELPTVSMFGDIEVIHLVKTYSNYRISSFFGT